MLHLPEPQGRSPGGYYSAYSGAIATDPTGTFDHYILSPDESHRRNGYWIFRTTGDDRRAYARGIPNPEAILCSADRGEHPHNDIILRWKPGRIDTNIKGYMTGCAGDHLRDIYDMRAFLGKSLSLGGHIPRYPVAPLLASWWEHRHNAAMASTRQPPVTAVAAPALPLASAESTTTTQSRHESRTTSSSPPMDEQPMSLPDSDLDETTGCRTGSTSPQGSGSSRNLGFGKYPATALNDRPVESPMQTAIITHGAQPISMLSLSHVALPVTPMRWASDVQGTQSKIHAGPRSHGPLSSAHSTASSARTPTRSTSDTVPTQDIPNGEPYHAPQIAQATHSNSFRTQINPVGPIAHISPVQSASDRQVKQLAHDNLQPMADQDLDRSQQPSLPAFSKLSTPERSKPSLSRNTPTIAPSTAMPQSTTERHRPHLPASPAISRTSTSGSRLPTVSRTPLPLIQARPSIADPGPSPRRDSVAVISTPKQGLALGNSAGEQVGKADVQRSTEARDTGSTMIPRSHDSENTTSLGAKSPSQQEVERSKEPVASRKRPITSDGDVATSPKKPKGNDRHVSPVSFPVQKVPSLAGLVSTAEGHEVYLGIACMECGEELGHSGNCHVGNAESPQNLTMLDYRNLADNAERFDPGPWTTHKSPAISEPQDADAAISGMASEIRNEDTYKSDPELHTLSDDHMIMLWAFKTSPDIEIIRDYVSSPMTLE
ncbi:hypothetical protein EK21DRAFT_88151 [Setomelanomma holmii]|uniref:Uncharacterized protein n=1 Tax=Setomelanomma holmii TaxID=210430 RepID=A0A9P4LMY8_9PLEO|nr:hypothetical protein EK21DRAFT_88151 [Setomelanomma holmii]